MLKFALKVLEGSMKGEEFLFDEEGLCLIGRGENCSISIPREKDIGISRRHCLLIIDPPAIRIRDLYSTNGTYVNNHRLIPSPIGEDPKKEDENDRVLVDGDKISISNIVMEVQMRNRVDSPLDTTSMKVKDPIPTTQTTKTRLIEFARGRTRSDSLIPEPNDVNYNSVLSPDKPLEDTRLFLSLPITEPIPRPKIWENSKKNQQTNPESPVTSGTNNKDVTPPLKGKIIKKEKTTPSAGIKEKPETPNNHRTVAEKPDLSIITGISSDKNSKQVSKNPPQDFNQKKLDISKKRETTSPIPSPSLNKELNDQPAVNPPEKEKLPPPERPLASSPKLNSRENEHTENDIESEITLPFNADKMRAMEDLAGTLAANFNNKLAAIIKQVELIKEAENIEKIRDYAEIISRTVQLSTEINDQLLMFVSDKKEGGYEKINLGEVLTEIVSVMKHTAGRQVEVNYTPPSKGHTLYTTGNQLEIHEALLNISFNALESISGPGSLYFQIQSVVLIDEDISNLPFPIDPGSFIKIIIQDSGTGISTDNFNRILDPFFTTKTDKNALGMGLSVAYGIIKNHKGAINARTSSSGGTTFEVYLQLTEK
jgi:signal transduction histidine kinase/pSer/pThr/pTyr-binding forkhead associated (FHA) protein